MICDILHYLCTVTGEVFDILGEWFVFSMKYVGLGHNKSSNYLEQWHLS